MLEHIADVFEDKRRTHVREQAALVEELYKQIGQLKVEEEAYLHDYHSVREGKLGIGRYSEFYNHIRLHQALQYRTPAEVHFQLTCQVAGRYYNVGRINTRMVS